MLRAVRLLLYLSLLAVVMSGCLPFLNPGQSGTSGQVTFHDTGLGIRSTVTVGQRTVNTSDGRFAVELEAGRVYDWQVTSLLGSHSGAVPYNGSGPLMVRIPPFQGWNRSYFNTILVTQQGTTVRWEYGRVKVWIEPPSEDDTIKERHVDLARRAVQEWSNILGGALHFEFVGSRNAAELTIEFSPSSAPNLKGAAGVCRRASYTPGTIAWGAVEISYSALENEGVYRHEVGHCVGLDHSPDPSHLMYPTIGRSNRAITTTEANLARLLYSINRSGRLSDASPRLFDMPLDDGYHFEILPDGTTIESLYLGHPGAAEYKQ